MTLVSTIQRTTVARIVLEHSIALRDGLLGPSSFKLGSGYVAPDSRSQNPIGRVVLNKGLKLPNCCRVITRFVGTSCFTFQFRDRVDQVG